MNNLKKMIKNNLYLQVDFSNKEKKVKSKKQQIQSFYLIGSLPIAVFYKNKKEEKAILKKGIKVKKDHQLRMLQGVKGNDAKIIGKYKKEVEKIIRQIEKVFIKAADEEKFNNKLIEKILIIKLKGNGKRKASKN